MAPQKKSASVSSGKTIEQRLKSFNRYRESLNPLKGLTIAKAVGLLEQYQRGEYADIMWTMLFVEQADADLFALIERRTSAITQLEWRISVSDEEDTKVQADAQAKHLRAVYNNIGNLQEAIDHLEMAVFRGYSVLQKQANGVMTTLGPTKLLCLDPWRLVRDSSTGEWYWNQDGRQTNYRNLGEANLLNPAKDGLMVRECKRNLLRIALLKFIRASLSEKDWDAFVEIYGIPATIIIAPENIPPAQEEAFKQGAEQMTEGGSGTLPHGSDVKYPDSVRGVSPFKQRLDHLSEKLILAGTGGLLTMLAQSGSGTLAGSAHQETFDVIARSDARDISEVFQKAIDKPELEAKFPGQPVLAYWELCPIERKDITQIAQHYVTLKGAGLKIATDQMHEQTGYELEEIAVAQPLQQFHAQPMQMTNRAGMDDELTKPIYAAIEGDLSPLRERITGLMKIDDPAAFRDALIQLRKDLPDMVSMTKQTEEELANILATAWANGIEEAQ